MSQGSSPSDYKHGASMREASHLGKISDEDQISVEDLISPTEELEVGEGLVIERSRSL
jgi:hypothetical protein